MDVQPTNLQQLCDAIMSIWTKISEECFQHLVESMPRRIKAVLKAKGGPTRYQQGVPCICPLFMYYCSVVLNAVFIIVFTHVLVCCPYCCAY